MLPYPVALSLFLFPLLSALQLCSRFPLLPLRSDFCRVLLGKPTRFRTKRFLSIITTNYSRLPFATTQENENKVGTHFVFQACCMLSTQLLSSLSSSVQNSETCHLTCAVVWCDLWVVSLIIMLVKYKRSQVPNYIVHKISLTTARKVED